MSVDSSNNNNKRNRTNTTIITLGDEEVEIEDQQKPPTESSQKDEEVEQRKTSFASKLLILRAGFSKVRRNPSEMGEIDNKDKAVTLGDLQQDKTKEHMKSITVRAFINQSNITTGSSEGNSPQQGTAVNDAEPNASKDSLEDDVQQRKNSFASKLLIDFRNNFSRGVDWSIADKHSVRKINHIQVGNQPSTNLDENESFVKDENAAKIGNNQKNKSGGKLPKKESSVLPELKDIGHMLIKSGKSLASPLPPLKHAPIKKLSKTKKNKKSSKIKKHSVEIDSTYGKDTFDTKEETTYETNDPLETGSDSVFEPLKTTKELKIDLPIDIIKQKSPKQPVAVTRKSETSSDGLRFEKSDNITQILITETDFESDQKRQRKTTITTTKQTRISSKKKSQAQTGPVRAKSIISDSVSLRRSNLNHNQSASNPISQSDSHGGGTDWSNVSTANKPTRIRSQTLSSSTINNNSTKRREERQKPQQQHQLVLKETRNRSSTLSTKLNSSNDVQENVFGSGIRKEKTTKNAFVNNTARCSSENSLLVKESTTATKIRLGSTEINDEGDINVNNIFSRHTSTSSTHREKVDPASIRKISRIHRNINNSGGKKH